MRRKQQAVSGAPITAHRFTPTFLLFPVPY